MLKKEQIIQDNEYVFPYHYIPKFRNGFRQTYIWTWGRHYAATCEFILRKVREDFGNIKSIADVGCGDGRLTSELAKEFPNIKVVGIDFSKQAINLAKALNPNLIFWNKDIINDSLPRKFDAITLIEVFEHIPLEKCNNFVIGLNRLLNDNGIIHITVPHINKPKSVKHFQHFDLKKLKNYFNDYFEFEEVVFFDKLSRWNRIMNLGLANNIFILNNNKLNNLIYKIYKRFFFFTTKKNCGRIYVKLKKK